jgi:hypothetical protein
VKISFNLEYNLTHPLLKRINYIEVILRNTKSREVVPSMIFSLPYLGKGSTLIKKYNTPNIPRGISNVEKELDNLEVIISLDYDTKYYKNIKVMFTLEFHLKELFDRKYTGMKK